MVRLGASALARAYRVMRREMEPLVKGVGSGRYVLHHEHSRALVLYHKLQGRDREKLITSEFLRNDIFLLVIYRQTIIARELIFDVTTKIGTPAPIPRRMPGVLRDGGAEI